jgi:putative endonuclease
LKTRKTSKMTSGDRAEDLALNYLRDRKFKLEQRNFNCRYGEIDLIMWDQSYLVFIEVRYRSSNKYGGALESIDHYKQAKLRRAAEFYLVKTKRTDCACRFDILCINGNLNNPDYEWIANAF